MTNKKQTKSKASIDSAKASNPTKPASKGLGKGLSALLGDNAAVASMGIPSSSKTPSSSTKTTPSPQASDSQVSHTDQVPIEKITTGPWQPRQEFNEDNLNDLAESIRQHGVVQPLLVRRNGQNFELIAGERRWRAAQRAGLHQIPVVIRDASDKMAAEIAMIENIQRHDLSAIEEAEGYRRLIDEFDYTQDALAKVIGKSRSHLANTMRLLNLPDGIRQHLRSGALTAGQTRPLVGREDAAELGAIVLKKGLSARQVEALVAQKDKPQALKLEQSSDILAIERDLRELSGFDVTLKYNDASEKGSITIKASNLEQFEAIISKLQQ